MAAYARDLGLEVACEMYCDSAAALGITNLEGIGKVRHLRTQGLWVQEVRASGRIVYRKVLGEKDPADLLTKHLSVEMINRHVETLTMCWTQGRAESAPTLDLVESYVQSWYEAGVDEQEEYVEEHESIDALHERIYAVQEAEGMEAEMVKTNSHQDGGPRGWTGSLRPGRRPEGPTRTEARAAKKAVQFPDRITVRPIPCVGKGRKTPPRGAGCRAARWQKERIRSTSDASSMDIAQPGRTVSCQCGGLMKRGDGSRWGGQDANTKFAACAGQWMSLGPATRTTGLSTVPNRRPLSAHRNVDSVARQMITIAQKGNTSYRGVELVRGVSGTRVRSPGPQFCGIGSRSSGRGVKRREFDGSRALRSCTDVGSASPDAKCAEGGER